MTARRHDEQRAHRLESALWALCGALVFGALVIAAIADVDPGEAKAATAAVLLLTALWLAHSWRQLWRDERRPRGRQP